MDGDSYERKKQKFWELLSFYMTDVETQRDDDFIVDNLQPAAADDPDKSQYSPVVSFRDEMRRTVPQFPSFVPTSWGSSGREDSVKHNQRHWENYMNPASGGTGGYGRPGDVSPPRFTYGNPGREWIFGGRGRTERPWTLPTTSTEETYYLWNHNDDVSSTTARTVSSSASSFFPGLIDNRLTSTLVPTAFDGLSPSSSPSTPPQLDNGNDISGYYDSINGTSSFNSTLCQNDFLDTSKLVYLYGLAFLVALALLLNGVAFGVFNTKALRKFAFGSYLAALAMADTLSLLSQLPRQWMVIFYAVLGWSPAYVPFYDSDDVACKAFTYVSYVIRMWAAWLGVALAAERTNVALAPFRKSNYRRQNTAWRVGLALLVVSLLVNSHVLFTWTTMTTGQCAPELPPDVTYAVTVVTVALVSGVPAVASAVLTIVIARGLASRSWRLKPQRMTENALRRLELERRAAVMVAVITGAGVLLALPYLVTWAVLLAQPWVGGGAGVEPCRQLAAAAARDVTEIVFMVNYVVKFALCICSGNSLLNMK